MFLGKYGKVANISLQNNIEYRWNFFINLIFSFIPFLANIMLWICIYGHNGEAFGFTLKEMLTYYFVILIVENLITNTTTYEVAKDIRLGDISKYLIKPINYMGYNFMKAVPKNLLFIVFGGIPLIILGFFLRGYLTIKISVLNISCFVLALVIGYLINFLLNYLLSILAFFFSEVNSMFVAIDVLKGIITGKLFPISIVPKMLYNFLMITPFQFTAYLPTVILLDKLSVNEVYKNLIIGTLWVILLFVLSKVMWKKGLRKYSAFGG